MHTDGLYYSLGGDQVVLDIRQEFLTDGAQT